LGRADSVIEQNFQVGSRTFRRQVLARMIDQDPPHHLRGDREKVRPILPGDAVLSHQAHVRLMHERRRLQRVIGSLTAQIRTRPQLELPIHDGHQPIPRLKIAAVPRTQQMADGRFDRLYEVGL
jgi:hypothetical protein